MQNSKPSIKITSNFVRVTVLNKQGDKIHEFKMRKGANLWVFLRKQGIPVGAACSGVGICGACSLKVVESASDSVSEKNIFEKETLAKNNKSSTDRLACLCRVYSSITVQADYW